MELTISAKIPFAVRVDSGIIKADGSPDIPAAQRAGRVTTVLTDVVQSRIRIATILRRGIRHRIDPAIRRRW